MSDSYTPRPEHHFTFGLWTVGNPGRDPFGDEVRPPLDPVESVHQLAELGAYGVNFHDDDLVPFGASAGEREAILKRFRQALDETGMKVPMATTNLFSRPDLQGRRLHRQRPAGPAVRGGQDVRGHRPRRRARRRRLRDVGRPRGHRGRGGQGRALRARPLRRGRRPLLRVRPRAGLRPASSPSSRSPTSRGATCSSRRSATRWPSSASSSGPRWSASTPSSPTRPCRASTSPTPWPRRCGTSKLFHIDLNAQRIGKYDQDFRFGSEGIRDAFYLVKLLEDSGWQGMRHFDAHAYRTEDADGVWDFARGCMRTYLILAEKARRFARTPRSRRRWRRRRRPSWPSRRRPAGSATTPSTPSRRVVRRGRPRRPGLRQRAPRPARRPSCCSASADGPPGR